MGFFSKPRQSEDTTAILAELENVSRELATLKGERQGQGEGKKLEAEITKLKKDIADLEINKDRLKETHDREKREVEHLVGLERKRQEFEVESAKREAILSVREENLATDRIRFEEQMQFMSERMGTEVTYLREIGAQLMERLPVVEVNKQLEVVDGGKATRAVK